MNTKKYRLVLYVISLTIVITLGIQFYWNYLNYQQNKQRVINEIHNSFDLALEQYYASITKTSVIDFFKTNSSKSSISKDSLVLKNKKEDSFLMKLKPNQISNINIQQKDTGAYFPQISKLTKVVYLSYVKDTIHYQKFDSILKKELNKKNIMVAVNLDHYRNDTIYNKHHKIENPSIYLSAKSTYLKKNERLELSIQNPTKISLKRSITGILLSLLFTIIIIGLLFYLLHIIKKQKELAQIKNDFISNITHEFKTPITTVSTAIEAIESFNAVNDKKKTHKYLTIATFQLKKLNKMVEKILETSTLDSEQLLLNKESTELIPFLKKILHRYQEFFPEKQFIFNTPNTNIIINLDPFHFENAIINLIDNAVKYGGNIIELTLKKQLNQIIIAIIDNGKGIEKKDIQHIFEQFYRVSKGNRHDIKGFGIGLYYVKKITEKHGGNIRLTSKPQLTQFSITLPYEN